MNRTAQRLTGKDQSNNEKIATRSTTAVALRSPRPSMLPTSNPPNPAPSNMASTAPPSASTPTARSPTTQARGQALTFASMNPLRIFPEQLPADRHSTHLPATKCSKRRTSASVSMHGGRRLRNGRPVHRSTRPARIGVGAGELTIAEWLRVSCRLLNSPRFFRQRSA
jgi:hypothetical protein